MSEEAEVIAAPEVAPVVADATAVVAPAESGEPAQNPAEQAPAKTEPAPGEGKNRFQRKLDNERRNRFQAEARLEEATRRLQEIEARQNAPREAPGTPKLEDFQDIESYAKAYAEHEKKVAFQEIGARQQQQTAAQQRQALVAGWEEKAASSPHEDFDEVVGDLQPTSPGLAAIMEADNGAEIAYYLGKNPDEAKKIAALNPIAQIRAIGRLEAKLAAEPKALSPTSKAPAPITALTGTGSGSGGKVDPKNYDAWVKARNKELGR